MFRGNFGLTDDRYRVKSIAIWNQKVIVYCWCPDCPQTGKDCNIRAPGGPWLPRAAECLLLPGAPQLPGLSAGPDHQAEGLRSLLGCLPEAEKGRSRRATETGGRLHWGPRGLLGPGERPPLGRGGQRGGAASQWGHRQTGRLVSESSAELLWGHRNIYQSHQDKPLPIE